MADRQMLRWAISVDDQWHPLALTGDPVAVAAIGAWSVEFWAENRPGSEPSQRWFRVFGTGHPLPADARWVGTCDRTEGGLVWHLYEQVTRA